MSPFVLAISAFFVNTNLIILMKIFTALSLALLNGFLTFSSSAQNQTWQPTYVGSDPEVLYLPDSNAVYWRYGWERQQGDQKGLVIKGEMPNVRYFSYNIYNDETKNSLGSLTDYELVPDGEGVNPFEAGKAPAGETYTIYILPEGTKVDAKNVLYFPDNLTKVSAFLRHYVPAGNHEGGVKQPVISSFDGKTAAASVAPPSNAIPKLSKAEVKKYLVPMFKKMVSHFEEDPEAMVEKIHQRDSSKPLNIKQLIATQVVANTFNFYRPGEIAYSFNFQTSGTYPNKDNFYLTMPVVRGEAEALVVKFKAPKLVKSPQDYPTAAVRYFSLCQGDAATYTHGTFLDSDIKVSEDGFVYFIIGDSGDALMEKAKSLGVNFMPWKAGKEMLLVYRHMLPRADFKAGIDKVPAFQKDKPAKEQAGALFIGDYAPRGKMINQNALLSAESLPEF
jgi:hypothetical protein